MRTGICFILDWENEIRGTGAWPVILLLEWDMRKNQNGTLGSGQNVGWKMLH